MMAGCSSAASTPAGKRSKAPLATPAVSSLKIEPGTTMTTGADGKPRPYYGKCQYKTGKCFNERTLKRNGEVHSLCEEHRVKQNLIQRRSDRKYQTVHAIRRRERSQRRAVLKKQVSMAVAQQLFYEHQQQKTLGLQLATTHHPLSSLSHVHAAFPSATGPAAASVPLAPPIQIPGKLEHLGGSFPAAFLNSTEGLASPILSFTTPSAFAPSSSSSSAALVDIKDEPGALPAPSAGELKPDDHATPTGIDDFAPESFLNLCCSEDGDAFANLAPILSARADRELWTEDDIEFLQNLLLA
ncbi:hypothetical protein ATCC90586_001020 [Pythium insidiosum]|nr:hypothetical protein ATCC90586_001020 [Pythium insidiosum]